MLRIILRVYRVANQRRGQQHAAWAGDVVGGSSGLFVPSSGEFLAKSDLQRKVGTKPDCVLNVPGSEQTSPTQRSMVGHHLKVGQRSLQERGQGAKGRHPQPT